MSVWGVAMVRDEADVIAAVLARMGREVDHLLVADNCSTDGTSEILRSTEGVTVLDDPDPEWAQARKMNALAQLAMHRGATWIVPFDADEVWLTCGGGRIADALTALPDEVLLARARMFDHVSTARDPAAEDPVARMVWRRPHPKAMPKVACRALPGLRIFKGNHHAVHAGAHGRPVAEGLIEVRHFGVRSPEQFVRKTGIAAEGLAGTNLPEYVEAHRRSWARDLDAHGAEGLVSRFYEEFWFEDPESAGLVRDPCP